MPSLTNYPNARPSLYLDFANSRQVDPRIEFTRATTATRINSKGVIEVVPANVPRIDYDPVSGECLGLLVEEARANLCLQSAPANYVAPWSNIGAFNNWSAITTAAPNIPAPDGTVTGIRVTAAAAAGNRKLSQRISVSAGAMYTFTAWVHVSSGQFALGLLGGLNNVLVAGQAAISPTLNVQGWARVSVNYVVPASGVNQIEVGLQISGAAAGEATIWGAQLEAGAFPTSYIPTTTAAATRVADLPQMTGSNFNSWYRQEGGALVCDYVSGMSTTNQAVVGMDDGSLSNRILILNDASSTVSVFPGVVVTAQGVSQANLTHSAASSMSMKHSIVAAFGVDDFASSFDGGVAITDASGVMPSINRLSLGSGGASGQSLNGHIKRVAYYPVRLSNAKLQALTAP